MPGERKSNPCLRLWHQIDQETIPEDRHRRKGLRKDLKRVLCCILKRNAHQGFSRLRTSIAKLSIDYSTVWRMGEYFRGRATKTD